MSWAETAHLSLDADGTLWLRADDDSDPHRLGLIDVGHSCPSDLADELAELRAEWADSPSRGDLEREWEQAWRAGQRAR